MLFLFQPKINYFEFRNGSIQAGRTRVLIIDFKKSLLKRYLELRREQIVDEVIFELSKEQKEFYLDKLRTFDFDQWNQNYINRKIRDGNQWQIIYCQGKRKKTISGSNAYPPKWNDFIIFIDEIIGKNLEN